MNNLFLKANSPNILIIGSNGRMGSFFMRRFKHIDLNVYGIDQDFDAEKLESIPNNINIVIFCIPAAALEKTLILVKPYLPSTAIITDITSVKVQPMECMEKNWSGIVIGTHPLFGPAPSKGMSMPIAITAGEHAKEQDIKLIENLFTSIDCSPFICTAKQHDKAMAAIQNLNFITSIAYFAALAPMSEDDEILPFLTPSFKRRQEAAKRMLTEDSELFTGLFKANPYSHEIVRKYRSFLNIAAGGDIELLADRAKWWWK